MIFALKPRVQAIWFEYLCLIVASRAKALSVKFSTDPHPKKCKSKCIAFLKNRRDLPGLKLWENILPWVDSGKHLVVNLNDQNDGMVWYEDKPFSIFPCHGSSSQGGRLSSDSVIHFSIISIKWSFRGSYGTFSTENLRWLWTCGIHPAESLTKFQDTMYVVIDKLYINIFRGCMQKIGWDG